MQHHTELTLPEEGWVGQQGPPEASWKPLAWELLLPSPEKTHTSAQVEPEQQQRPGRAKTECCEHGDHAPTYSSNTDGAYRFHLRKKVFSCPLGSRWVLLEAVICDRSDSLVGPSRTQA